MRCELFSDHVNPLMQGQLDRFTGHLTFIDIVFILLHIPIMFNFFFLVQLI